MTHDALVKRALVYLRRRRCVIYGTEVNATSEVPDAIGWTCWGESVVVECKASRADFLADAKKPHRGPEVGMGSERLYLAPDGLLDAGELPDGWGLVEARGRLTIVTLRPEPREVWDRHADCLALLHLARRACDYNPSALHAKIQAERAEQRDRARRFSEAEAESKAARAEMLEAARARHPELFREAAP
ncbi:MAG: hypothetical protein AAF594_14595 [Bacteroidota bacterium]